MVQRIVRGMRVDQEGCRVTIAVDFATPYYAERFKAADGKRAMGALRGKMASIARGDPDRSRDRSGELQPQLPADLREKLAKAAEKAGTTSSELIRNWLGAYVDFETGERKKDRTTKQRKLPTGIKKFRERGHKLRSARDPVRLTFDTCSEENKAAVLGLVRGTRMNLSEFFTALIDRHLERVGADKLDYVTVAEPLNSPTTGQSL